MNGIALINKPRGVTSASVIASIKRMFGKGKVTFKIGHGGTLDPEAQGLLIIGMGKHTKVLQMALDDDKAYQTTIDLSYFTDTDDVSGEKEEVKIDHIPTDEEVKSVVHSMIGKIEQVPSKFSAIKIGGKRAYDLAREGVEVKMKSRIITIHDITIKSYKFPSLTITVKCSKGTYIRTLGRDIGTKLGTGGCLTELIRLQSGGYSLDDAMDMEQINKYITDGILQDHLIQVEIPKKKKYPKKTSNKTKSGKSKTNKKGR